jgi:hypothetical protein
MRLRSQSLQDTPGHPGDQDVALDVPCVNVQARSSLRFAYRSDATVKNIYPMKVHATLAHLCKLYKANVAQGDCCAEDYIEALLADTPELWVWSWRYSINTYSSPAY